MSETQKDQETQEKRVFLREVGPDESGLRVDRWFKRHFPALTHGQLQKWLRKGSIRLDGKRTDSGDRIEAGQTFRLPPVLGDPEAFTAPRAGAGRPIRDPSKLKSMILYQDDDVVVLNKPPGLAVQGGTGLKENLDDSLMALSLDGVTRPKLVHRLDRDTSGVLLIARNDFAAAFLSSAFRRRQTRKIYWALTVGVPKPERGMIDAPLIKGGHAMRLAEPDDEGDVKSACTLYQVVESAIKKAAFVALWPLTGRTHQLRVHLASLNTPILGDPIYMGEEMQEKLDMLSTADLGKGLHLHARRLIIPHPRRGIIDVTAPLSPAMRQSWKWFGFDEKADVTFDDA